MLRAGWHQRKWTAPMRALLLLVLATALAGQSLLVGAHRHEPTGRAGVAAAMSRTAGHHDAHGCAICEMQRVGGHYLPAVDPVAMLAVLAAWVAGAVLGRPLPRLMTALGWRSRAPPAIGV